VGCASRASRTGPKKLGTANRSRQDESRRLAATARLEADRDAIVSFLRTHPIPLSKAQSRRAILNTKRSDPAIASLLRDKIIITVSVKAATATFDTL